MWYPLGRLPSQVMISLGVECMRQVCVLWCATNTRTSRPAGHRSVSVRNTLATIRPHLYDCLLKTVFRKPSNGTFGHLAHVHFSELFYCHNKSIFLFITFDFVKVTTKSSIQACPTINFVHYVELSVILFPVVKITSLRFKRTSTSSSIVNSYICYVILRSIKWLNNHSNIIER